jgi:hypothetical protein
MEYSSSLGAKRQTSNQKSPVFYGNRRLIIELAEAREQKTKQANSVASVRERTVPTERPPLVGEVIANFCG